MQGKFWDMASALLESIERYLRQGKWQAACHLVLQAASQSAVSPASAADTVATALQHLLDEFIIEPVLQLADEMDAFLPAEICTPVRAKIGPRLKVIRDWSDRMILVSRERQARDLRAAIRAKNLPEAEQCVAEILRPAEGAAEPDRALVEYVGSVLGSVDHGQREAEQLIARLRATGKRFGLSPEAVEALDRARLERQRGAARGRSEFQEAEFVRDLNALTVELKTWLPNPRLAGPPAEEHIARFYEALHAITASYFRGKNPARWIDITEVLVEFCPRELSLAGRRSGVEERAYMTLTPTARRTVFEAFGRLGRNEAVAKAYLEFAETLKDERLTRHVVEVMGALRSRLFLPWLRKTFEGESRPSVRSDILTAVSNYADGDSAELLLRGLRQAVQRGTRRGIIPEGADRREIVETLFALGRLVRSPRLDPGGRNEILKHALAALPNNDLRLQHELAYQCFCTPAEGWNAELRDWAVATLTRGLWLPDLTPDFAQGDERQSSILGPRAAIVQALTAIGRDGVPAMLRACEDTELRFGSAYIGVAEALGQIQDPAGLDLLERLLANALLFEGSDRTKYQAEKYYDPTENVRKEITPDQVIAALLFAIERIGTERADLILVRAYNQIRSSGAASPGAETDAVLERVRARYVREGRWNDLVKQAAESGLENHRKRDSTAEREEAARAMKVLQTRLFLLGRRRERKIAAIQTLAAQRNLEAFPLILKHIEDSDPMVAGAARTALGEYAWAAGDEKVLRNLMFLLLDALRSRNENVRDAVRAVLKRLGPGREPLHSRLRAISEHDTDPLARAEAARLLREGTEADALETLGTPSKAVETEMPQEPAAETAAPATAPAQTNLDYETILRLKREYLLARQKWVRGGKKGDPPQPPPGIS